ncbi:uncharacterized protein PG998_006025 [Apiospora kogelbergensis]|uniref:Secreted protein n=1 Tax=Apiospora kogelbergensis TaxID=1337665 RepID=A0AAW0R414_9PEZI
MSKASLLSLVLFATMAALSLGVKIDGWKDYCPHGASIAWNMLTAYCNTGPMGPPWQCSQLDLNLCYAYDKEQGIYAKKK